ncbi:uncharacterized protein LOC142973587 [Anticarsia gemmatalis]|uniref:uncharacterized protein LOC142973587 n=1 Tax=Anticarsia gemmatalis TaxID=129554 RepID=UPI003F76E957
MWKKCKDEFYFKFTQDGQSFEISVTDYLTIWTAMFTEKAFIAQLKDSNDGLEIDNNELVQKGLYLLTNWENLQGGLSIRKEENGNSLFICLKHKFGYPFRLECKLLKGSSESYFEKVTKPLLKTIGDLRSSQSELRRLLIKKDKEIEEYKFHVKIDAYRFKTPTYHDDEHMNQFRMYEENFGSADIPTQLLEKSANVPEKIEVKKEPIEQTNKRVPESTTVKQEPTTVKSEPGNVKPEPMQIKEEPHTPVLEEPSQPIVAPTVSCKQELVKTERQASQNDRRKRMKKLNY